MLKLSTLFILSLILVASCGSTEKPSSIASNMQEEVSEASTADKVMNALVFLNGYIEYSNTLGAEINIDDWINSSTLASRAFKLEFRKIIDDANELDPEMGLGFDPILDAQDYPEKGFELESFDEKTNYLTVKGIDWADFKVTMKVIEENGNWIVDGCGIVNIPEEKRATR